MSSRFAPLDEMPKPDIAVCEQLISVAATAQSQDLTRCVNYRAPTLKQATENIAACYNTEVNRVTGTPYVRQLFGWYKFCAEKTNGRNVTADEIRRCFHDSLQHPSVDGRLLFDTCIAQADRQKSEENP